MNNIFKTLVAASMLVTVACSPEKGKVTVQNTTDHDSLTVIVTLNNVEIFNGPVKKALSNVDATGKDYSLPGKQAHVRVSVPSLSLTSSVDTTIDVMKEIYVSVYTELRDNMGTTSTDSPFLKKDKISIALFKEISEKKAL